MNEFLFSRFVLLFNQTNVFNGPVFVSPVFASRIIVNLECLDPIFMKDLDIADAHRHRKKLAAKDSLLIAQLHVVIVIVVRANPVLKLFYPSVQLTFCGNFLAGKGRLAEETARLVDLTQVDGNVALLALLLLLIEKGIHIVAEHAQLTLDRVQNNFDLLGEQFIFLLHLHH